MWRIFGTSGWVSGMDREFASIDNFERADPLKEDLNFV